MSAGHKAAFVLAPVRVPASLLATPDPNSDPENRDFRELMRTRLARFQMQCSGCGFKDVGTKALPEGFLGVHHLNHNHADNRPDNLFPICVICHDILHIGFAPDHDRGEVLIGDDLLSQVELTNIVRTCMVAAHNQQGYAESAEAMYAQLRDSLWASTRAVMPAAYTGSVRSFGEMLQSGFYDSQISGTSAALSRVRYLPRLTGYQSAAGHWAATTYAAIPESEWPHYAA